MAPAAAVSPPPMQVIERLLPRAAEEVAKSRFFRGGWYGYYGVGKTSLLGTVQGNWWVVSIDRENVNPLKGKPNIRVIHMEEWEDLDDILHMARVASKSGKLAGIAFDTWTRVQAHAFNHVVGRKIIDPFDDAQIARYMDDGPRLPQGYTQWQQVGSLCAAWMDFYTALPLHTVFLFQEITKHPRLETDILVTEPMLRPEALNRAMESLQTIGYLYVEVDQGGQLTTDSHNREINANAQEHRMLLLGKHPRFAAKGDTAKLGYVLSEPTWEKLAGSLS